MLSPGRIPLIRTLRRKRRTLALAAAACTAAAAAIPAYASGSASVSIAIPANPTLIKSVTVSPPAFTFNTCGQIVGSFGSTFQSTGDQMVAPNGECGAVVLDTGAPEQTFGGTYRTDLDVVYVTNSGSTAEFISVQASDAVPADGGTPWKLTTRPPGVDQYAIWNGLQQNYSQWNPTYLTSTPAPDKAVDYGVGNAGVLQAGTTSKEWMGVEGPTASSDPSTQFSTTITWIAS